MFGIYSLLYSLAFVFISPMFLLRREKYASGFSERLGNYPEFKKDRRKVIWLHCVSVGETQAARPLVDKLLEEFPNYRLVFSTTTRTGQDLAKTIFKDKADAVFYFPFDWKFSVSRALRHYAPSVVLLMETEIWPRFFRETDLHGAKLAIVNGRLSERSFRRYSYIKPFIRRVLGFVDLALMQGEADATRIKSLGIAAEKVSVTGNLKFDLTLDTAENELTEEFRRRFGIDGTRPVIVAASTHEPEEESIVNTLDIIGYGDRLIIAPRHPERFDAVAKLLTETQFTVVHRSSPPSDTDKTANIILLDSIGELRAIYPLADIVFVGGSLIPHGGQSVLEPAAAGKAIIIGPYTHNFEAVVKGFLESHAIIQTNPPSPKHEEISELYAALTTFLYYPEKRAEYGNRALEVMNANRGATDKTVTGLISSEILRPS